MRARKNMRKDTLINLIQTLNAVLNQSNDTLEILVIGGANMCIVQGNRDLTHDIDSYCLHKDKIKKYRKLVAQIRKVDETWLNDVGELVVNDAIRKSAYILFELSNLRVWTASDEAMLAMKLTSGREAPSSDIEDAAHLLRKLNVRSIEHANQIVGMFYPRTGVMHEFYTKAHEKSTRVN